MIDANMIESITEQSVDQLIHGSISPQISLQCVVISPVNYQTKRARENGSLLRLIFDLFFEKCNMTKYPSLSAQCVQLKTEIKMFRSIVFESINHEFHTEKMKKN